MNAFKKKSLYAALAGVSVLGAANVAQAVNVNDNGTGQVLLYPYYTTRVDALGNEFSTLISVVNTTGSAKAVKVRFLEGMNSREVLDFNLFLSPYDVWTAAVSKDAAGGAKVGTRDKSCTIPTFPASGEVAFVNYAYSGTAADGATTSLDRTKEGYIEIIEMATYQSNSTTGKAVTHVKGVAPCGTALNDTTALAEAKAPAGGLFGSLQLINGLSGTAFSASATALDNFATAAIYYNAGSIYPNLNDVNPVSQVMAGNSVFTSNWDPGVGDYFKVDAVSAALTHSSVMNEYVLDANTASRTDWVVTFPTKSYYVTTTEVAWPFQRNFNGVTGSCDDILLAQYDREEQTKSTPVDFSPPPPAGSQAALCWEANVLSFNATAATPAVTPILGSKNASFVGKLFENGWVNLSFPAVDSTGYVYTKAHLNPNQDTSVTSIISGIGSTTTGQTVTYAGLPVVGFAVSSYTNGTLNVGSGLVQSSYGVDFAHKYATTVTRQPN